MLEQRFADGTHLPRTEQDATINKLEALIAEWNLVEAEYHDAAFDRREELCDVKEDLRAQLAEYLDVRAKRKVLQSACRNSDRLRLLFAKVCRDLAWSREFERALRLG